jgi:hypothetical protein
MDDQRTDRASGGSVNREKETRQMQAILMTLIGGFFGAAGMLGLFRGALTFGNFYMLIVGCSFIVTGIVKYRRILEEENNFPTT